MAPATRESWKVLPLPRTRENLGLIAEFNNDETMLMKRGHLPRDMEDKWFIFHEDSWLFFHRSWTGSCIYWIRLEEGPSYSRVAESWVSRDPDYKLRDLGKEQELLIRIIQNLLLGTTSWQFRHC